MTTTTTIPRRTIPSHVRRRVLGQGVGRVGRGQRTTRQCPSRRHRRDGRRERRSLGGGWAVRRGRRRNGKSWVRRGENPHWHYRRSSPRTMRASLLNRHRRRKMRGMDLFSSSSSQREVVRCLALVASEPPRCKAPRGGRGDATACDVFAGEQFLQGRVRYRKFWPIKCRSMCRVAGTRYDRYIVCARHLFCGDVCVNVVGGRRGVWVKTGDSVRAVQSTIAEGEVFK